jgi:hypothetical protein
MYKAVFTVDCSLLCTNLSYHTFVYDEWILIFYYSALKISEHQGYHQIKIMMTNDERGRCMRNKVRAKTRIYLPPFFRPASIDSRNGI